jgi:signal transduction histidine kinase/CheY-like chemotaxis protein
VLDYVQSLAHIEDVETLLDRVAEICARLAGFHVGVLTAHMEDGSHVGTWNLSAEEREAFRRNSRGSTVEGTAGKRARIRAMSFPGTGIAYVPHDAELSRSQAFVTGRAKPGGTWHPEDRLFVLLRTTQGRDIGVLSLDEPLDGRAPTAHSLGALKVAERFLDLGGALLETRLLRAQIERTQRLEAVGTLVAGIAHDFNNVLGAIMGYASLLRVQLPPESELAPTVRTLEESCERAAGLTRRLRALTQGAPAQKQALDVAALVADAAKVARDTFVPRMVVETDLKPGLPPVMGDAGSLSRALLNLCINARDAQPEGGRITLRAYPETPPEGGLPTAVRIEVEDAGPGLSPQARQHLFEPFFTTKPHGKGTGLGLFSAWSTARGHGGSLEAVDRREAGGLFRLRLPAAGVVVRKPGPSGGGDPPERRRVLVVEDESPMQDLIRHGVELLGHHVEAVWDGQEAIDVLERRAGDFDLVILDLLLPRRSGTEVFHVLKSLRLDLPVILSSGNVEEALLDAGMKTGVAATLAKPWTVPHLQEVVQRVLAASPGTTR